MEGELKYIYIYIQYNLSLSESIYKVVISVCLFVHPIITQEPLNRFALNFDWGTREDHGDVFSLVLDSKLSGSTFIGKNS